MKSGQGGGARLPLEGYDDSQSWGFAGSVARAYELSDAEVAFIVGPTGGGKSTASARKILRAALKQHASPRDGVRRAKICVVTATYRKAWDQVIPSYKKVFGWTDVEKTFRGAVGNPANHKFAIEAPMRGGGTGPVEVEVLFRATNDQDLEEFVRGFEVTGWWLPEADTLESESLLSLTSNRVGRFPEPDDRPDDPTLAPAWAGVFGDANAPVIGNWFYNRLYLQANRKPGDAFFRQPGGFDPNAENMQNLKKIRPDYYANLAARMEEYDVGRLINCKPGYSRFGKPVHPLFDDVRMVSTRPLEPLPGQAVIIGADAGNTLMPAATFKQRAWNGQWRVLAEIAPIQQMDIMAFGAEIRRIFETRFGGKGEAVIWVDPSAVAKSTGNLAFSYAALLQGATGIAVQLAPSNNPLVRRTATDRVLARSVGNGAPGLIVDPACTGYIEAMAGGYRFKKLRDAYAPQPEKNDHSHIAEADQYGTLGGEGLPDGSFIAPHARAREDERSINAC